METYNKLMSNFTQIDELIKFTRNKTVSLNLRVAKNKKYKGKHQGEHQVKWLQIGIWRGQTDYMISSLMEFINN